MICPSQIAMRWVTAVMGCFGFVIIYGLRVNLSVGVLAMVNHTAVHNSQYSVNDTCDDDSDDCSNHAYQNTTSDMEDGPFNWDEQIQGVCLGSYFYGYIFTQILGGVLAEKFSAKHVYGTGVLVNAVSTLLIPPAAHWSYMALMALRIIMGATAGMTLPAMHVIIASWCPPQERSKFSSTVYAGCTLGTLIFLPLSGILASEISWEWMFYIEGSIALVYYVLWLLIVTDTPTNHPMISRKERDFILATTGESESSKADRKDKMSLPILKVMKSPAVWAIIIAHTCSNWGWYMLLVKLPTYMKHIFRFDMKSNSSLSALPYLTMWVYTMILAAALDYLRAKGTISTTFARKFATVTASIPPGICLIAVTFVGNITMAVALLTVGMTCLGGMFSGFLGNHIDIAPPFAGTLMGISNTFATVPGIVVPSIVGYVTNNNQTVEAWRTLFYITMGVFLVEAVAFSLLGSGERQEWAKNKKKEEEEASNLVPK